MKLGVNNEVNPETKKAALKLMAGSPSKINPPNSHPSNPIHKAATAESRKSASSETQQAQPTAQKIEPKAPDKTPQHEINKMSVIVSVVGLSALLFMVGGKLLLLLKIFFEQKRHRSENKQPGVLCQKPDDLAGSFE